MKKSKLAPKVGPVYSGLDKFPVTKRGPWKGFRQIKMPKVSWLEMEQRAEEMWDAAILEAIGIVRKHNRYRRLGILRHIMKDLRKELVKRDRKNS